jgi:hypothetical protein
VREEAETKDLTGWSKVVKLQGLGCDEDRVYADWRGESCGKVGRKSKAARGTNLALWPAWFFRSFFPFSVFLSLLFLSLQLPFTLALFPLSFFEPELLFCARDWFL